jgi:hypothetical protein
MSKIQDSSIRHKRRSNAKPRPITTRKINHRRRTPRPRGVITTTSRGRLLRFNSRGKLPRGIHTLTWQEFSKRFAYNPVRQKLLRGLLRGIRLLQNVGCHSIYIGGSFVTTKEFPSDVDVIWESSDMSFERVERVSPVFLEEEPGCPYQKSHFGAEFYPSECIESISGLSFLEFFQCDFEQGRRRGIVRIDITYIPSSRPQRAAKANRTHNRRTEEHRPSPE